MRSSLADNRAQDIMITAGFKLGMANFVPVANQVITKDHPPILRMTPGAAGNILLPESNAETKGMTFIISNVGGTGTLTFLSSASVAFTPAITVATNANAMVTCTGEAGANGWRLIAT